MNSRGAGENPGAAASRTTSDARGWLDCEVVPTESGAPAVFDRVSGEVMHPIVGAEREAEELYARPARLRERLAEPAAAPLVLFDVGLGAGSNALAAWKVAHAPGARRRLEIVSFERSLNALELAISDPHARAFGFDEDARGAARAVANEGRFEGARVSWRLALGELPDTLNTEEPGRADVVFWDPFSLQKNPRLWSVEAFRALRRATGDHATVHTYSSATATRAALLIAGFFVGEGSTTGAARPTTVAATDLSLLERPLDARWLERLRRSSAPFPPDAPTDAFELARGSAQFQLGR